MLSAVDEDIHLMWQIAAGDRRAFRAFLLRHLSAVVRFAAHYNRADAEDIAQDAFLRVWQRAGQWQEQGVSPLCWVYRITYHLCIDTLRRRRRETPVAVQPEHADPQSDISNDIMATQVRRIIATLPERQATALTLCAIQGMSNREAADVMDISVEAMESLLARARRELRKHLFTTGGYYLHG